MSGIHMPPTSTPNKPKTIQISPSAAAKTVTVTEDEIRRVVRALEATGFYVVESSEFKEAMDVFPDLADCCEDGIVGTVMG